ncbi:MAG: hypothetical protein MUE40_08590 [Anaerolineae bacterium]|nr:hypothetical protein [Anaerolineae bacterium]
MSISSAVLRGGLALALLLAVIVGAAQDITPLGEPPNPNLAITFPPPVYVLREVVEVRGTVNVPGLANYFLEFRPLVPAEAADSDTQRPWFPAALPVTTPVQDAVLGLWNTRTAPDGLYELRLTVNITGGGTEFFRVSPLRIDNASVPAATPTPTTVSAPARPTLVPTPTSLPGGAQNRPITPPPTLPANPANAPLAIALNNANVRSGDDVTYPRVGLLLRDEFAVIVGISSLGTGWYYVELTNGVRGFVAPSVVRTEGNLTGLPPVMPPPRPTPLPVTPTFTPTITPIPASATPASSGANLAIVSIRLEPAQPTCQASFGVFVTVINNGTGPAPTGFSISAVDRHSASGTVTASTTGAAPALQPGQTFVSEMYLTVGTFFNETHSVGVVIDSGAQVAETNEGDNSSAITYTLAQGGC